MVHITPRSDNFINPNPNPNPNHITPRSDNRYIRSTSIGFSAWECLTDITPRSAIEYHSEE